MGHRGRRSAGARGGGFVDFASRDKALDSGDVVAGNPSIHGELSPAAGLTHPLATQMRLPLLNSIGWQSGLIPAILFRERHR